MLNDIKCLSQNLRDPGMRGRLLLRLFATKYQLQFQCIFWAKLTDQFYRGMVRRVDIEEALATM